jgi:hypothetical protein
MSVAKVAALAMYFGRGEIAALQERLGVRTGILLGELTGQREGVPRPAVPQCGLGLAGQGRGGGCLGHVVRLREGTSISYHIRYPPQSHGQIQSP